MSKPLEMLYLPCAAMPPDHTVAWRNGQMIRNDTFQAQIQAWHTLLESTSGRKFALYLSDSLEFASALFGGWLAGKTLYLPSNILPATCVELRGIVDGYLGEFADDLSPLTINAIPVGVGLVPAQKQGHPQGAPLQAGLVIFTSGSTGNAQAIPKRLSQLATEVATLENLFGNLMGHAEIIATVSHQHIYGLLFKILWPLAAGRAIHVHSAVFLEELAPVLTTRDCVLVSSPAHLKRFPDSPASMAITANHVRAIFSSGSSLPPTTTQRIGKLLGQIPIEIYGSSETGGIAWRHASLEWQPMPNIAWRIATENNVLEIQSPHLPNNNWFRTADRATPTQNSCFLLQGRTDQIVKLEGKRISLTAIEHQLMLSPWVTEARVLLDENNQRQRIAAFVVLNTDGHAALTKIGKSAFNQLLRNTLINAIEPIALPRSWRYLNELPVNAQGKTTPTELIALLNPTPLPILPQQRLLEQNAQRAVLELTIPPNLLYFNGHFPAAPILPGVVQIDWAIAYGRQCFELPPFFRGIQALKFQRVIEPSMTVMLELLYDTAKSMLTFRLYSKVDQHASGRILFGISND